MWVIGRLLFFVCGFTIRFFINFIPSLGLKTYSGVQYRQIAFNRDYNPIYTSLKLNSNLIYIPSQTNLYFKLTPERSIDKFFKFIGFSKELQTGNHDFDDKIYVACDHPYIDHIFKTTPSLQKIILDLFDDKTVSITNSDARLIINSKSKLDINVVLPKLNSIKEILELNASQVHNKFKDIYFYRALILESLIWSIAFYSFGSLVSSYYNHQATYLQTTSIINLGVESYIVFIIFFLILVKFFLIGSSRGHRILVESILVFILCLPIACLQAVSDINIYLDRNPTLVVKDITILRRWEDEYGGLGHDDHTYHIEIQSKETPLPQRIDINSKVYASIGDSKQISIEIGKGYFNIPWYKKINNLVVGGD